MTYPPSEPSQTHILPTHAPQDDVTSPSPRLSPLSTLVLSTCTMPASPSSQAEELTVSALEALSLSDIVPLPPPCEPTPPPSTPLESLPANIPLPTPPNARATHAHHLLRHVMTTLHTALRPPHTHLPSALSAITALALSTPVYRRLLAHLGVVRLLPSAFVTHAETGSPHTVALIDALAACLTDGDELAVTHFSASKATEQLLSGWTALEKPSSRLLAGMTRSLASAMFALQPPAMEMLCGAEALRLFQGALANAISHADARVAIPTLEALARLVQNSDDMLIQAKVREIGLLELAAETLNVPGRVRDASLDFLRNAVEDNIQNVVALGAACDGRALRFLIRCAREGGEPTALIDLAVELCKVRKYFDTMLSLGLSGGVVECLGRGVGSALHIVKAMELLERGVKNSEAEGRKLYAKNAAAVTVSCMQAFRTEPDVQAAGIRLLVAMMESFSANSEAACDAFAVQAVQLALAEHSREGDIVGAASAFFLQLSPLQIMRSRLVLGELKKVIRAKLKFHKDGVVVTVVENLVKALELVAAETIKSIEEFLGGDGENSALAMSPRKKPLSFRKSFHKAVREGKRRVCSDFAIDSGTRADESQRLRGSRALEKERSAWPGFTEPEGKRPSDHRACEALIDLLGRDEESSSQSSSTRSAGVGSLSMNLSMAGVKREKGTGENPVVVRRVKSEMDKRGKPISFTRRRKADTPTVIVEAVGSEAGEGSLSSLSDSDLDSIDDDAFAGKTCAKKCGLEGERIEKRMLSEFGVGDEQLTFDPDEYFPELDEGNTDSGSSQHVMSSLTDLSNVNSLAGTELMPKSKRYGERERSRSDGLRNSGNWGSMKAWQLGATEEVRVGGGGMTRGESGSLGALR